MMPNNKRPAVLTRCPNWVHTENGKRIASDVSDKRSILGPVFKLRDRLSEAVYWNLMVCVRLLFGDCMFPECQYLDPDQALRCHFVIEERRGPKRTVLEFQEKLGTCYATAASGVRPYRQPRLVRSGDAHFLTFSYILQDVKPCEQNHYGVVFAKVELSGITSPTDREVEAALNRSCTVWFELEDPGLVFTSELKRKFGETLRLREMCPHTPNKRARFV